MDVQELLKKLSERIPGGWLLNEEMEMSSPHDHWFIFNIEKRHRYEVYPDGDIGLAPLTALLKQSLPVRAEFLHYEDGWYVRWDVPGALTDFVGDNAATEFEAVCAAYLEAK